MKHIALTVCCIMSFALIARAEPPPATIATAEAANPRSIVMQHLVAPWRARTREFSRVPRPAPEMRVRILDRAARHDARGEAFVWFEIDSRRPGKGWRTAVMKGCVYPSSKAIYLQEGDELRDASAVLGIDESPAPATACKDGLALRQ